MGNAYGAQFDVESGFRRERAFRREKVEMVVFQGEPLPLPSRKTADLARKKAIEHGLELARRRSNAVFDESFGFLNLRYESLEDGIASRKVFIVRSEKMAKTLKIKSFLLKIDFLCGAVILMAIFIDLRLQTRQFGFQSGEFFLIDLTFFAQ